MQMHLRWHAAMAWSRKPVGDWPAASAVAPDGLPPLHRGKLAPRRSSMFFFFSNKLGWLGSILVSILLSLLLIGLFWIF
jgi:hypothetical protein